MTLIDLHFSLETDGRNRDTSEVRAWIDLQPDVGLGSEIVLPLRRRGARDWHGSFGVGRNGLNYFLYRIGIAGHEGAAWELTLRERRGAVLMHDADVSTMAKYWLVGSCDIPVPQGMQSARQTGSAGPGACTLLGTASLGAARYLRLERFEPAQYSQPKHDRPRDPAEKKRFFVLSQLGDQRVRALDKRLGQPERDDGGV
jgi:hypothetical protein